MEALLTTSDNPAVRNFRSYLGFLLISGFPASSVAASLRATSVRARRRKVIVRPGPSVRELPCIAPFFGGCRGAACISIDLELAWGRHVSDPHVYKLYSMLGRRNVGPILSMFNHFDFPATWATVGHLILSSCRRDTKSGLAHADMPRVKSHSCPCWGFDGDDWFGSDPCTSVLKDPAWYGRDLVEEIVKTPRQELASHSFSHIDFGSCSDLVAESEIDNCKRLAGSVGSSLKSMVFPCNRVGKLEILREAGLIAYRGFSGDNAIQYPVKNCGLWDVHQTMQVIESDAYSKDDAMRYIDRAIESGGVCHLWFHEYDISRRAQSRMLSPILAFCASERSKGRLWVATMREIANYCETRAQSTIRVRDRHPFIIDLTVKPLDRRFSPSDLTLLVPRGEPPTVNGAKLAKYYLRSEGQVDYYAVPTRIWVDNDTVKCRQQKQL